MRSATLKGVAEGRVTVQFRRWKRPTVKAGGTLLTPVGQLSIHSVDVVDEMSLSEEDALAAGFDDVAALRSALEPRSSGTPGEVYRVALTLLGPDPRIELRSAVPSPEILAGICERFDRWDVASPVGPWTHRVLSVIDERPGVRAGDLAQAVGLERARFKTNVRKLKGLGLTESLEVGYRLSPRGRLVLEHLGGVGAG